MTEATNWGCPDWRDQEAYPVEVNELEQWQWRWEFLRRLPKYRESWLNPKTLLEFDDVSQHELQMMREKGIKDDDFNYADILRLYPTFRDVIHRFFNMRVMTNPSISYENLQKSPFVYEAGKRFVLPHRDDLDELFESYGIDIENAESKLEFLIQYLEMVGLLDVDLDHTACNFVFIRFDFSRPLEPQLDHIKLLKEEHKKWARLITSHKDEWERLGISSPFPEKIISMRLGGKDSNNWPIYLRLVDAQDQGAKPVEIFEQVQRNLEADGLNWQEWEDLDNPAAKIMNMQKSARQLIRKAALYL